MKKVFSLMLLLATLVIALPSCSDDKDEPDAGIKENIIGTWDATSVKFIILARSFVEVVIQTAIELICKGAIPKRNTAPQIYS